MTIVKERKATPFIILIVLMMLSQKLALQIGGFEFSLSLFFYIIFLVINIVRNNITLSKRKILLFLLMIILCFVSTLINFQNTSITSFLFLILLYFLCCFDYKLNNDIYIKVITVFKSILVITAIIGILQFCLQLLGVAYIDVYDYLPSSFKLSGFNTYYPIDYGSTIYKSNGWIYLEPSFFSQFMAIGILLELTNKNKKSILFIFIYVLAIIVSFSGTGIFLLFFSFVLYSLSDKRKKSTAYVVIFALILCLVLSFTEYGEFFLGRIIEITNKNSSAAIRFVNPIIVTFKQPLINIIFGSGAGMSEMIETFGYTCNFSAYPKLLIEYGFIASIAFLFFILKLFYRKNDRIFSLCIFFMYMILGGNLLQPSVVLIIVFVNNLRKYK